MEEIRRSPVNMVVYPIIYRVSYIPGGCCLGFLNHQQYDWYLAWSTITSSPPPGIFPWVSWFTIFQSSSATSALWKKAELTTMKRHERLKAYQTFGCSHPNWLTSYIQIVPDVPIRFGLSTCFTVTVTRPILSVSVCWGKHVAKSAAVHQLWFQSFYFL